MRKHGEWEVIDELGEGGQSQVFKVRTPARSAEREKCLENIRTALDRDDRPILAQSIWSYARPDELSELAALKIFKIPENAVTLGHHEAVERLRNEITVLKQRRRGLPEIFDSNESQRWLVTELIAEGSLEKNFAKYQGRALPALRALRSLVATVAALHGDGYVHRDIKPANVFIRKDDELVLGDFGIVYMPAAAERLTKTDERVGPRDYMPQWADLGERLEKVHPNFDVYMLGKLLWCMIAGRLKLPREYHRRAAFDLSRLFPDDTQMHLVNGILDKCVVEEPDLCLSSAKELLKVLDENLAAIEQRTPLVGPNGRVVLPCRICGKGFYTDELSKGIIRLQAYTADNRGAQIVSLRLFVCNVCTHRAFFAPNYPDEGAARNWTSWREQG